MAAISAETPPIIELDSRVVSSAPFEAIADDTYMRVIGDRGPRVANAVAFRSKDSHLEVDVSTYEPVTLQLLHWPVDELMTLLDGQVDVEDGKGHAHLYVKGDTFLMPRGFSGRWHERGSITKIAVTYTTSANSGPESREASSGHAMMELSQSLLARTGNQMQTIRGWPPFLTVVAEDKSRYIEVPIYASSDGRVTTHVKRFEKASFDLQNWPIDEYMHFLAGRVEITNPGGKGRIYGAGDSIVIPRGFSGHWRQLETIDMATLAYDASLKKN